MAQARLGIDIGSRAVHLVSWDGKGLKQSITQPLPQGAEQDAATLAELLKALRERHRLPRGPVSLVLPAHACVCRRLRVRAMTHRQLKVNLPYELRDFLPQAGEYVCDYAVLGLTGEELELLAAAAPKETVAACGDMFRRAGFRLGWAIPEAVAYTNLRALSGPAAQGSVCLLDLGDAAVRIHLLRDGAHHSDRTLDFRCADLDGETCARIALEVRKAVNYYNAESARRPVEWVCCWGAGAEFAPLREALESALSVPAAGWERLLPTLDRPPASLLALGAALQRG